MSAGGKGLHGHQEAGIEPSIQRITWQKRIDAPGVEVLDILQVHQVHLDIPWVYQVHHLVEQLKCLNSDDCVLE